MSRRKLYRAVFETICRFHPIWGLYEWIYPKHCSMFGLDKFTRVTGIKLDLADYFTTFHIVLLTCRMIMYDQKLMNPSISGFRSLSPTLYVRNGTEYGSLKDPNHIPDPMAPITQRTRRMTTHQTTSQFIKRSSSLLLYRGPLLFFIAFVSCPTGKTLTVGAVQQLAIVHCTQKLS